MKVYLFKWDIICQYWNSQTTISFFFKKWAIPGLFFFIFVFSIQLTVSVLYKSLPMTGFELRTYGVGSNRSTNWVKAFRSLNYLQVSSIFQTLRTTICWTRRTTRRNWKSVQCSTTRRRTSAWSCTTSHPRISILPAPQVTNRAEDLFVRRSITVRLTSCLTGLDSIKRVNLFLIQHKQSSWIQTSRKWDHRTVVLPL